MKKRILSVILSVVMIFSMSVSAIYADAGQSEDDKIKLTVEEESQIKAFLHDNGVDDKTTNKLINKYKKGILWDSLTGEYSNIEPTSITEPNGSITQRYVYPDGSIKIVNVELPSVDNTAGGDNMGIQSVSGGTWVSGSGYSTCYGAEVSTNYGLGTAYFYADFTFVNGGYDYISDAYDHTIAFVGGTISNDSLSIVRSTETSLKQAEAKLNWLFTAYGGGAATTMWIKLLVGRDTCSSAAN